MRLWFSRMRMVYSTYLMGVLFISILVGGGDYLLVALAPGGGKGLGGGASWDGAVGG